MLFQNRYRVPSHRKEGADYAGPGCYFVTICAGGRMPWFGEIRNGIVGLTDIGCVVNQEWERNAKQRSNIELGPWIIMPDHLHGIIYNVEIDRWSISRPFISTRLISRDIRSDVAMSIPLARRRPGELGSIIAQFKGACTKRIWEMGHLDFRWQRNYHDRIIRNDPEHQSVQNYIFENPLRSTRDRPAVDLYRS